MIGASDLPLPNDPFIQIPSLKTLVRFPRDQFPTGMTKGDELLYYAVGGYKKLFAQVRLAEDPRRDVPTSDKEVYRRWPHGAEIELGPHLDWVEFGPDLWSVNPRLVDEIHQGVSHFPIGQADFDTAVRLIRQAILVQSSKRTATP
jgi:hypothetical protein